MPVSAPITQWLEAIAVELGDVGSNISSISNHIYNFGL